MLGKASPAGELGGRDFEMRTVLRSYRDQAPSIWRQNPPVCDLFGFLYLRHEKPGAAECLTSSARHKFDRGLSALQGGTRARAACGGLG